MGGCGSGQEFAVTPSVIGVEGYTLGRKRAAASGSVLANESCAIKGEVSALKESTALVFPNGLPLQLAAPVFGALVLLQKGRENKFKGTTHHAALLHSPLSKSKGGVDRDATSAVLQLSLQHCALTGQAGSPGPLQRSPELFIPPRAAPTQPGVKGKCGGATSKRCAATPVRYSKFVG